MVGVEDSTCMCECTCICVRAFLAGLGCSKLAGAIDLDSRACSGGRGAMNVDVLSGRPGVFQIGWGDRFG